MTLILTACIALTCSDYRVPVPATDCAMPITAARLAQSWAAAHGVRLVRWRCADASEATL